MFPHVTASKKIPRLLVAQSPESFHALKDIQAIWPDRQESKVYDLSFGGMVLSANPLWGRVNPEQNLDFLLRVRGFEDPLPIKAKIKKISSHSVGLIFDNQLAEGRLAFEQVVKDRIVSENLHSSALETLPAELQSADVWLHGPFDTNVILWKKEGTNEIEKAIVEYDNLVWIWQKNTWAVQRSLTATDESSGYYNATELFDGTRNRVSMGASWLDRLCKLLSTVNEEQSGDLQNLVALLKTPRAR